MADQELRALEREALAGDADAALRLALELERRDGEATRIAGRIERVARRANGKRTYQVLGAHEVGDVAELALTGRLPDGRCAGVVTTGKWMGRVKAAPGPESRILELHPKTSDAARHAWSFALATDLDTPRQGGTYALAVIVGTRWLVLGAKAGPWTPPMRVERAWPELGQAPGEVWSEWMARRAKAYEAWATAPIKDKARDRVRAAPELWRRWALLRREGRLPTVG